MLVQFESLLTLLESSSRCLRARKRCSEPCEGRLFSCVGGVQALRRLKLIDLTVVQLPVDAFLELCFEKPVTPWKSTCELPSSRTINIFCNVWSGVMPKELPSRAAVSNCSGGAFSRLKAINQESTQNQPENGRIMVIVTFSIAEKGHIRWRVSAKDVHSSHCCKELGMGKHGV